MSPWSYTCCENEKCRTEPRDRVNPIDQPKNSAKESCTSKGRDHGDKEVCEFMPLKFCFCESHLNFDRSLFLAFWQVEGAKGRVGSPLSCSMVKFPGNLEESVTWLKRVRLAQPYLGQVDASRRSKIR